jgi:hypothetical protein
MPLTHSSHDSQPHWDPCESPVNPFMSPTPTHLSTVSIGDWTRLRGSLSTPDQALLSAPSCASPQ